LFRVPVLFHLHGGGFRKFYEEESGTVQQILIRFVLKRASTVIVLVDAWRDLARQLAPQADIVTLPNPVLVPATIHRNAQKPPAVLFLGLITERKGVFDLVRAMPAVLSSHPDCRFVIAGNGKLDALRAEAEKLGVLPSLETPGWITGAEKTALLERASLFVLPSYFEAMPMSLLEAMAHGLPCIASRVGGIPDVMADKVEGLLLPPGKPDAWAEAVKDMLSDSLLAQAMGRAARDRVVGQFSAEAGLARLGILYDRYCQRNTA
jgi:glycosyltransferase involved in cell wall biosynthesis